MRAKVKARFFPSGVRKSEEEIILIGLQSVSVDFDSLKVEGIGTVQSTLDVPVVCVRSRTMRASDEAGHGNFPNVGGGPDLLPRLRC